MSALYPPQSEIVERGTRIYEEQLRSILEPRHNGKYIVIDVETREYELDEDHLAASDRAAAKKPGVMLYATRVGFHTLGRIGGRDYDWKYSHPSWQVGVAPKKGQETIRDNSM